MPIGKRSETPSSPWWSSKTSLSWLLVDRSRSAAQSHPDLNMIVILVAGANLLVAGRAMLAPLRRSMPTGFIVLCGISVLAGLVSLAFVDYSMLDESGPVLPTVLVVSIVLALFRKRRE